MKRLLLLTLCAIVAFSAGAQTYEQGMVYFKENKRQEAVSVFSELVKKNQDVARSSLAIAIIHLSNEQYMQAFQSFRTFFNNAPDPYPHLYALSNSGIFNQGECATSSEVKKFFQDVLKDPRANVTIKAYAADLLARREESSNDFAASRKTYSSFADIKNWNTVGVFNNVSASGFNKDFGVVSHPEPTHEFVNAIGARVKWFNIPDARNDRWLDFEYHYDISDAIIYAQTFIASGADREVVLRIGVSGSLKVWVNDFLVGTESEERNTDMDVYNYQVKLQKGTNRVLLQLGSGEVSRNNFMARITDLEGNLLPELQGSYTYQPYTKAAAYPVKKIKLFAEEFFEKEVERLPDDLINQIMLLNVYNHNDKRFEARKVAANLKKLAPVNSVVSERLIEAYIRDNNNLDATKEQEFIKTADPEGYFSLTIRYNQAKEKEKWDEAEELLNKRKQLCGETPGLLMQSLTLLEGRKEVEKLNTEMQNAIRKYPDNLNFVALKYYAKTNNNNGGLEEANDILKTYLAKNFNTAIHDQVYENYIKLGKADAAIKMLKNAVQDRPYALTQYQKLANTYYNLRNYDEALEWEQKVIDRAPYDGRFYYWKGMLHLSKGEQEKAKEMLKKAIYYTPTNYEAREKIRTMEGKKELSSYFPETNTSEIYKNAMSNPKYASEDLVLLVYNVDQIVYPESGAGEEHREVLVYINSESAIDEYKEVNLPYNSYVQVLTIDKAEVLKKDGSKVPAETNGSDVVFSTVEKGDAIYISYKLENHYRGKLSQHFWNEFSFDGSYPVANSRFSLIVPSDKQFRYKVYNGDIKPDEKVIDNYKMYTWARKDIPKVQSEMLMPTTGVTQTLVVSSIPDWSYVADWYTDLSAAKAKPDFEIKEKVKEILKGNESADDLTKAKIIYSYIEQNFHYSNISFLHSAFTPQRAARTLNAKLGDCKDLSTLFVAMAKEAGLIANLVLVSTRGNDDKTDLPSIEFNHCIAQLNVNNKNYLVELTNNFLPFGALDNTLINAKGLYIPREGERAEAIKPVMLNTTHRPENIIVRNAVVTFNNSQADILRTSYRTGASAAELRASYYGTSDDDLIKGLTTSLSSDFGKNVKLRDHKVTNLKNLNDTLWLDYKVQVDNFTSEIVGMQVFTIPWTDIYDMQSLVSIDTRAHPICLWSLSSTPLLRETMEIAIPAGKKLVEVPKDVTINCSAMSYSVKYSVAGDKLRATREVRYLKEIVPVNEYNSFREFITSMGQSDKKQIAFK